MNIYNDVESIVNAYKGNLTFTGHAMPQDKQLPAFQIKKNDRVEYEKNGIITCKQKFEFRIWDRWHQGCETIESAIQYAREEIEEYEKVVNSVIDTLHNHNYKFGYKLEGATSYTCIPSKVTENKLIGIIVSGTFAFCKKKECCEDTMFDLTDFYSKARIIQNERRNKFA